MNWRHQVVFALSIFNERLWVMSKLKQKIQNIKFHVKPVGAYYLDMMRTVPIFHKPSPHPHPHPHPPRSPFHRLRFITPCKQRSEHSRAFESRYSFCRGPLSRQRRMKTWGFVPRAHINGHHARTLCYCRASLASPGGIRARRTLHYNAMLATRKEEEEEEEEEEEKRQRERKIASTCSKGRGSDPTGRNFDSLFLNCRLLSLFLFRCPPPPTSYLCFLLVFFHCNILMMHTAHFAFPIPYNFRIRSAFRQENLLYACTFVL